LCASVALATTSPNAPNTTVKIGDGGRATEATINGPSAIALDQNDNLYILELDGRRVRMVDAKTGIIQTVAGNGLPDRIDILL